MCGIAGIAGDLPREAALAVRRMSAQLIHRGPDSEGVYEGRSCILGFRRLRVIDIATGDQPIPNEDRSVWVVMNGEIYNFRDLRRELVARGHAFRTQSDTEVVVHAYEEYGESFLAHLRGMYAIALWDERQQRLLLARDRLGKKPLHYLETDSLVIFASELKALLMYPGCPRDIDRRALGLYLAYGYVPAPATILKGVRKLPPASFRWFVRGRATSDPVCYWTPSYAPKLGISEEDAARELARLLREAVRVRMVSEVPLGAMLSGGIDSSLVTAMMAESTGGRVKTFTVGFEEEEFDERKYARLVAGRYMTDHHEIIVRPDATAVTPSLVRFLDEPVADSSALPTYYVAQMAKSQVTVVLTGDGGDETFGGYNHYRSLQLVAKASYIPAGIRRQVLLPAARTAQGLLGSTRVFSRICRMLDQADLPLWERHKRKMEYFGPELTGRLLGGERGGKPEHLEAIYMGAPDLAPIDAMLRADLLSVMPGYLLVKMDRMSMAHSLEARSPLLDQNVIEFAARLPVEMKIRGPERKRLLRRVAQRLLPPELLSRRKQGFSVPMQRWMCGGALGKAYSEVVVDPEARIRRVLNAQVIDALSGPSNADGAGFSPAQKWALLVLEYWMREVLGVYRSPGDADSAGG